MAKLQKIDSNVTGLSYAEEASIGVLPATPVWNPLEPNGYTDFGGQLTTIARNPINPSRQRKKGVVTDLDASGGFGTDLTQENLQDLLQGFMFADARRKAENIAQNVDGTNDEYDLANRKIATAVVGTSGGTGYEVGDVLTIVGGTSTVAAVVTVATESSNVVVTVTITEVGAYSVEPSLIDNAATGGTGTGVDIDLTMADISTWAAGDLAFGKGFSNPANNGLKEVTGITAGIALAVADVIIDEVSPPSDATVVKVGVEGAAGDIDVDASLTFPALTSTTLDFEDLGLVVGEDIFVGGDAAGDAFSNAANNGFKRVRSIAPTRLEFDKSAVAMVTEPSTTETIRLFFGRVLKNELGTLIKRRTYQLERTLGAPDDALPAQVQSEYLVGSVANELSFNIPTADKLVTDLSFVSIDNEQRTGAVGVKSGTRPSLVEADAFNTSSDFSRIKMAVHVDGVEAPEALFAFVTELTLTINNNASPNKAVGVLGAFEVTTGTFVVNGSLTAYFSDVAAIAAVRNNSDVTVDFKLVKANAGISVDIPLMALGDGRANIEQDQPITLPLSFDAATGAKIDTDMDHTLLMVFFDFLPTAADV